MSVRVGVVGRGLPRKGAGAVRGPANSEKVDDEGTFVGSLPQGGDGVAGMLRVVQQHASVSPHYLHFPGTRFSIPSHPCFAFPPELEYGTSLAHRNDYLFEKLGKNIRRSDHEQRGERRGVRDDNHRHASASTVRRSSASSSAP